MFVFVCARVRLMCVWFVCDLVCDVVWFVFVGVVLVCVVYVCVCVR